MIRVLAVLAALLLLTTPVTAQAPAVPPAGTILVVAAVSDGMTFVPLPGAIAIPAMGCAE